MAKSARSQMETIIFSFWSLSPQDNFHNYVLRLTNETLFDMGITEDCELKGVVDKKRPLKVICKI